MSILVIVVQYCYCCVDVLEFSIFLRSFRIVRTRVEKRKKRRRNEAVRRKGREKGKALSEGKKDEKIFDLKYLRWERSKEGELDEGRQEVENSSYKY